LADTRSFGGKIREFAGVNFFLSSAPPLQQFLASRLKFRSETSKERQRFVGQD
jgi:hypothetical protein